jgi:hypothetical protein
MAHLVNTVSILESGAPETQSVQVAVYLANYVIPHTRAHRTNVACKIRVSIAMDLVANMFAYTQLATRLIHAGQALAASVAVFGLRRRGTGRTVIQIMSELIENQSSQLHATVSKAAHTPSITPRPAETLILAAQRI